MTVFYRGAAPGTYWNTNDARLSGFTARTPGMLHSADRVIQHVYNALTNSPYVSLSLSYGVALHYALEMGTSQPTALNPGFVYEVEVNASHGVDLIDPVKAVATGAPDPLSSVNYQHNGSPTVLLGVVSPVFGRLLFTPIPVPPGAVSPATHTLSMGSHVWALTAALRDAEILVRGSVPASCVVRRHSVY